MILAPTPGNQIGEWKSPIQTDPFSVSIPDKVALLLAANEAAAKVIDDPLAAAKVRDSLPEPPPGGWWYFGRGWVEAWTRRDPDGWVLHEVVSVWLEESGGERPVRIAIRPHPWGWDHLL